MVYLSLIQSLRMAAVLEDCSHQVDIVGHSLTVKISKEQAAQEKARLTGLWRDCQQISQLMSRLLFELVEKQSFISLLQAVETEEKKKKKVEAYKKRKENLETLLKKEEEAEQKTEEAKDKDVPDQLSDNVSNTEIIKKAEEKEEGEEEEEEEEEDMELELLLAQGKASRIEKLLQDQLNLLQTQMKEEMMFHERSKELLQNQHEKLQEQLHSWQKHTKQLLHQKEEEYNSLCCKRTLNLDRLNEMKRKLKVMELVVMEDKEEQEKLRLEQEKIRAATKLQAYWRGQMVRRGLGSYKKADEGKKGKKKKEGKKKKKK